MSDDDLPSRLRDLKEAGPVPRPGFTDAVMQQVTLRKRPQANRTLWDALFRTRSLTVRFRVSQLVAAGAMCALVGVVAGRKLPAGGPTVKTQHAMVTPSSPLQTVRVRFTVPATTAHAVSLVGDFNGWRPDATPLERGADGVWTVTLPLSPGSWAYSFFVDGAFVEDAYAETYRADGFGGRNAIVRVGS
jgi:hypothetical protein